MFIRNRSEYMTDLGNLATRCCLTDAPDVTRREYALQADMGA